MKVVMLFVPEIDDSGDSVRFEVPFAEGRPISFDWEIFRKAVDDIERLAWITLRNQMKYPPDVK